MARNAPRDRKIAAARVLLGGACVSCGAADDLQFDHVDPSTKRFNVSTNTRHADFWQEVAKCQLLCRPCHKAKSSAEYRAITKCPSGHDYTPENTYVSSRGLRRCRACDREGQRRRRPQRIPAAERASCVHGHPWPENLRLRRNGTTVCTACEHDYKLTRR